MIKFVANKIKQVKEELGIPTFVMMVGIPGSGKSTVADKLKYIMENEGEKKDKIIILSSDALRREILGSEESQENNGLIFSEMRKRSLEAILEGKSVIYDATNTTIKNRESILEELNKSNIKCYKLAYLMSTPFRICLEQNKKRERVVPEEILLKFRNSFQIPLKQEGFDDIVIYNYEALALRVFEDRMFVWDNYLWSIVGLLANHKQNNPHHDFSLLVHSIMTYEYLKENNKDTCYSLFTAGLLHDLGKLRTKVPNKKNPEISSYYGHANVGTYELLHNLDQLGLYSYDSVLECLALINYHMDVFSWENATPETIEAKKKFFGEDFYNKLLLLHEADVNSSKFHK